MSKTKVTSGSKRRWTREFKLAAVMRMNAAASIKALAEELGVRSEAPSLPSSSPLAGAEQRRIEELERKIGQQQLDLDFFRTALRHVGEQRLKKGGPGGRASSR